MAASDYAYTTVPSKIAPFLGRLQEVGVPQRATQSWLQSIGFTSTNDRPLLNILRQIRFVDANGRPTTLWEEFRAGDARALGRGIRDGYGALFDTFPDANRRSTIELENVVKSTAARLGKDAVGRVVSTFKTLVSQADLSDDAMEAQWRDVPSAVVPVASKVIARSSTSPPAPSPAITQQSPNPTINLNITVTLPESASRELYRDIFAAMRELWSTSGETTESPPGNEIESVKEPDDGTLSGFE